MLNERHQSVDNCRAVSDMLGDGEHLDSCRVEPSMGDPSLPASPLLPLQLSLALGLLDCSPLASPVGFSFRSKTAYGCASRVSRKRRIRSIFSSRLLLLAMLVFLDVPRVKGESVPSTSLPGSIVSTSNPSSRPTETPKLTPRPSTQPSPLPSVTPESTMEPSVIPTGAPSGPVTFSPTPEPTFDVPSLATATFRQRFTVGNDRTFTPTEVALFQDLYEGYTVNFAPPTEGSINTTCEVGAQVGFFRRQLSLRNPFGGFEAHGRYLQAIQFNEVDFLMTFVSLNTNVTAYVSLFQIYLNENLDSVIEVLQEMGFNVSDAANASRISVETPGPTVTFPPSIAPSVSPTTSLIPSGTPSDFPTSFPHTLVPSKSPQAGPNPGSSNTDNTVLVISVGVAGSILLIGFLVYFRRRKMLDELAFQTNAATGIRKVSRPGVPVDEGSWGAAVRKPPGFENASTPGIGARGSAFNGHYSSKEPRVSSPSGLVSASESLKSGRSLLSAGNSMAGDSADEADATQNLADEFDQYKDQNLEKMRADVEGNVTGFDGMMSQALTKALIDDDEAPVEPSEYLWGAPTLTGYEIEASALGEVTDWLKRKGDSASVEEK
jgi:hypothetical protein